MASVLCAEVCVKCFVCRALCNNEHNSAFALLGPRSLCTATHCFVCNDCRGVSRVHCSLCFVLTCKQWSVWCPICAICSVCSVGSGVFGGRLGMRRAEFPGARVSGGGGRLCASLYCAIHCYSTVLHHSVLQGGVGGGQDYTMQCTAPVCHYTLHCRLSSLLALLSFFHNSLIVIIQLLETPTQAEKLTQAMH